MEMIAALPDLLAAARTRRAAVGAFGVYDAETAAAVLRAGAGVLLVSAGRMRGEDGRLFVAALRGMAAASRAPVCIQGDHLHELDAIVRACEAGADSVMADGSHLAFEANVAFTREARAIADRFGASVEGEIGRLAGAEDADAGHGAAEPTDPEAAAEFAARTGVDCLAVSIGNVHGTDEPQGELDWDRLAAIRERVDVPLSLHGGSGLDAATLRRAVAAGIAKANVNTDLRHAYLAATEAALAGARETGDLLGLHRAQADAVATLAAGRLRAFRAEADVPRIPTAPRG
jgi:tagatose 1,6-diphosphate aldolase GatY/KbaY